MAAFRPIAVLPSKWEDGDEKRSPVTPQRLQPEISAILRNFYGRDISKWNQLAHWIRREEENTVHPD